MKSLEISINSLVENVSKLQHELVTNIDLTVKTAVQGLCFISFYHFIFVCVWLLHKDQSKWMLELFPTWPILTRRVLELEAAFTRFPRHPLSVRCLRLLSRKWFLSGKRPTSARHPTSTWCLPSKLS